MFTVVNELVRPLGPLNLLVYGGLLVVLFVLFREGLVVVLQRLLGKLGTPRAWEAPAAAVASA